MQLFKIEDQSFHIYVSPKIQLNNCRELEYVTECMDKDCPYTRSNTNIRYCYEKIMRKKMLSINQSSSRKNNLSVLFYGSWYLYQELCICLQNLNLISEIHLTDYGYGRMAFDDKSYMAIDEFTQIIKSHKSKIKIFVHTNPNTLYHSKYFKETFDIICGIDVDYSLGVTNNRPIMEKIAINILKKSGIMIVSQNSFDIIDISKYNVGSNCMKLRSINKYVKKNKDKYFMILAQKINLGVYLLTIITFMIIPFFDNKKIFSLASIALSSYSIFCLMSNKIKTKIYSLF